MSTSGYSRTRFINRLNCTKVFRRAVAAWIFLIANAFFASHSVAQTIIVPAQVVTGTYHDIFQQDVTYDTALFGSYGNDSQAVPVSPGSTVIETFSSVSGSFDLTPLADGDGTSALGIFLYIDQPDSQTGSWDNNSLNISFQNYSGSPTPPINDEYTSYNNGSRIFLWQLYPVTQPASFTSVTVSYSVPSDAASDLVMDDGIIQAHTSGNLTAADDSQPFLTIPSVPEPTIGSLLLAAGAGLLLRHRRPNMSSEEGSQCSPI